MSLHHPMLLLASVRLVKHASNVLMGHLFKLIAVDVVRVCYLRFYFAFSSVDVVVILQPFGKASDGTKKVGGGGQLRCRKIATAIDDELPLKAMICKKWGLWPPGLPRRRRPFLVNEEGVFRSLSGVIKKRVHKAQSNFLG